MGWSVVEDVAEKYLVASPQQGSFGNGNGFLLWYAALEMAEARIH